MHVGAHLGPRPLTGVHGAARRGLRPLNPWCWHSEHTMQEQREHERLESNLLRLKRNAPRPENGLLQPELRECYPR
jgi:hypothetical protein